MLNEWEKDSKGEKKEKGRNEKGRGRRKRERERDMVGWHRKENENGKVKEFRSSQQRNKSFSGNVSFSS